MSTYKIFRSLLLASLSFAGAVHARPVETHRFSLGANEQSCTRADGSDYVCGTDGHVSLIEVALERVDPDALEDSALEGRSEPIGLGLSSGAQYLPQVSVRKSVYKGEALYTIRFRTVRNGVDRAPVFETVYIEGGDELTLAAPLTLMADRNEKSPRFFRQAFFSLAKLPEAPRAAAPVANVPNS